MKLAIAFLLAFAIGAGTRWTGVPLPAPPRLAGALLILAMTAGYLVADRWLPTDRSDQAGDATGEGRR